MLFLVCAHYKDYFGTKPALGVALFLNLFSVSSNFFILKICIYFVFLSSIHPKDLNRDFYLWQNRATRSRINNYSEVSEPIISLILA